MNFLFLAAAGSMLALAVLFLRPPQGGGRAAARLPLFLPMILVPVLAVGGYLLLGEPRSLDDSAHDRQPPVGHLVAGLEARLAASPDDRDGWLLLARSYRHLGMAEQAKSARNRAAALDAGARHPKQAEGKSMRGHVALAPQLVGQVDLDDTVFIFAKESPSQRMPVAALRRSVRDLPLHFELTDAHAMVRGTHLDDFASLVVTARISPTGRAADTSSIYETWSDPVRPGEDGLIDLVIADTARPKENMHE